MEGLFVVEGVVERGLLEMERSNGGEGLMQEGVIEVKI